MSQFDTDFFPQKSTQSLLDKLTSGASRTWKNKKRRPFRLELTTKLETRLKRPSTLRQCRENRSLWTTGPEDTEGSRNPTPPGGLKGRLSYEPLEDGGEEEHVWPSLISLRPLWPRTSCRKRMDEHNDPQGGDKRNLEVITKKLSGQNVSYGKTSFRMGLSFFFFFAVRFQLSTND